MAARLREKIEDTPLGPEAAANGVGRGATGCIQFKNRLNAQGPLLKKFRYTGYSSKIFLGRVPDDSNSISLMGLQLAVLPGLCTLGFGVLAGVAISISAIRAALQKYRSQMVWLILGLMLGSLYAIANGPASLATPRPALSMATFQPVGFVLGATVLLALEGAKMMMERKEQPGVPHCERSKTGMNLDWIILHGLRVLTACPLLDFWCRELRRWATAASFG